MTAIRFRELFCWSTAETYHNPRGMSRLRSDRAGDSRSSLIIECPMAYTPLQDALSARPENHAQPAALADYRGATTTARFSDPHLEFAALVGGCGMYDLGFRAW